MKWPFLEAKAGQPTSRGPIAAPAGAPEPWPFLKAKGAYRTPTAEDPPYFDAQVDGLQNFGNYTSQFWGPVQFMNAMVPASQLAGYSVLAFGADPTGTVDSTAAFNGASAAAAGQSPVLIPPGTFKLTNWAPSQNGGSWLGAGQGFTTLTTATASPVIDISINLTGARIYRFAGFTINGENVATFGIFMENNAAFGKFVDISIFNCGVGVGNAGQTFQCDFRDMNVRNNGVGVQIYDEAEGMVWRDSTIAANTTTQVEVGDGTTAVPGPITFDNCQVTMTTGTVTSWNMILKSASLVNLFAHYSEVTSTGASGDISIQSSAQNQVSLNCIGNNSNGNSLGPNRIVINAGVTNTRLLIQGDHDGGYTGAVYVDNGTASSVRVIASTQNSAWVNDTFNGTALVYP